VVDGSRVFDSQRRGLERLIATERKRNTRYDSAEKPTRSPFDRLRANGKYLITPTIFRSC